MHYSKEWDIQIGNSVEQIREMYRDYILRVLYKDGRRELTQADRLAIAQEVLECVEMIKED